MHITGLWKRQDGSQQQLQSLWEIYSGQLQAEWDGTRVSSSYSLVYFSNGFSTHDITGLSLFHC